MSAIVYLHRTERGEFYDFAVYYVSAGPIPMTARAAIAEFQNSAEAYAWAEAEGRTVIDCTEDREREYWAKEEGR